MPLFILTQPNINAAKVALRMYLPDICSGHRTEALASGLGFNTNAALRTAIAGEAGKPPALTDAEPGLFARRLKGLGYTDVGTGAFVAAMRQDVLDETPYTWFRKGDRAANALHFHACEARNRPMMMVKMARQYAELEWDCVTIDSGYDKHVRGPEGDDLMRIMFRLFQERARRAPGKPLFYASAFTGSIQKLLPNTARQLAEDYFKLLYLPLRDLPPPRRQAA